MSAHHQIRYRDIFFLVFLTIILNACSHNSISTGKIDQQGRLLSGELLLGEQAKELILPDTEFLKLNDEMREFARQQTAELHSSDAKIRALLKGLYNSSSTGFRYSEDTLTASETFSQHSGNCLSFSALFIALAREVGIEAKFNEVEIPASWGEQNGNTFVLYKHINASIMKGSSRKTIVDITRGIYKSRYPQSIIPDSTAEAQFYNNIAIEYMGKNNTYEAFRYLKKAISLSQNSSYLWSNLATLYRRENHDQEAQLAFNYAIKIDPRNLTAISSLQRLYQSTGEIKKALNMQKKADRIRDRNPYFRYRKAIEAFRNSNFKLSETHSREAIKKLDSDHRFHLILGASQFMLGKLNQGEETIAQAIKLADDNEIKTRYGQKLKLLKSIR